MKVVLIKITLILWEIVQMDIRGFSVINVDLAFLDHLTLFVQGAPILL